MFLLFGKYRVGESGRGVYETIPILRLLDMPPARRPEEPYLSTFYLPVCRCLRGSVVSESLIGGSARSTKHFQMEASEMTLNRGLLGRPRVCSALIGSRPW